MVWDFSLCRAFELEPTNKSIGYMREFAVFIEGAKVAIRTIVLLSSIALIAACSPKQEPAAAPASEVVQGQSPLNGALGSPSDFQKVMPNYSQNATTDLSRAQYDEFLEQALSSQQIASDAGMLTKHQLDFLAEVFISGNAPDTLNSQQELAATALLVQIADTNKNGQVSTAEVRRAADLLFKNRDRNKDGRINQADL